MTDKRKHERKVRGSQIRSSRDEKKKERTRQHEEKEVERLEKERGPREDQSSDLKPNDIDDSFIPEEESFVETPAVKEVEKRVERWLNAERPVHLIGPTGCGKTALAMHIAHERDRPVIWINGDTDLTTSDLVGEYAEKEKISERDQYIHNVIKSKDIIRDRWVDNPLTVAVREGATLVYNEFSRTKPVANNVLLSVFEEGVLELPGKRGESRYIDVHPEFRAILTSNSVEYAGVHQPQDALLDRLIGIHMDFYDYETETEIVESRLDFDNQESPEHVKELVSVMRELRDKLDINVGTRAAIMAAEGVEAVGVETVDQDTLIDICIDVLGSKVPQRSDVDELRDKIESTVENQDTLIS